MFPLVTDALIAKLDEIFPRDPKASMSHREVDHLIGQQMVVEMIKRWREEGLAGEEALNPLARLPPDPSTWGRPGEAP
jgi:hypothetical protein